MLNLAKPWVFPRKQVLNLMVVTTGTPPNLMVFSAHTSSPPGWSLRIVALRSCRLTGASFRLRLAPHHFSFDLRLLICLRWCWSHMQNCSLVIAGCCCMVSTTCPTSTQDHCAPMGGITILLIHHAALLLVCRTQGGAVLHECRDLFAGHLRRHRVLRHHVHGLSLPFKGSFAFVDFWGLNLYQINHSSSTSQHLRKLL